MSQCHNLSTLSISVVLRTLRIELSSQCSKCPFTNIYHVSAYGILVRIVRYKVVARRIRVVWQNAEGGGKTCILNEDIWLSALQI
jgi:hypothetical protein